MELSFKNPIFRFLIISISLMIGWYIGYEFYIKPWRIIDDLLVLNLEFFGEIGLKLLGYDLISDNADTTAIRTLGIDGSHGIWIGDNCNGLTLFALFTGFVLAYPGPVLKKIWFIPLGVLIIHFLNIIRVLALSIIAYSSPEYLDFNHTYTFTAFVYFCVFGLWYIWATKLSTNTYPIGIYK